MNMVGGGCCETKLGQHSRNAFTNCSTIYLHTTKQDQDDCSSLPDWRSHGPLYKRPLSGQSVTATVTLNTFTAVFLGGGGRTLFPS